MAAMVTVLVHEAEDGETGFWAEVPELPGCVSQGETLDERLRRWHLPLPEIAPS